jgi:hypothetical protein
MQNSFELLILILIGGAGLTSILVVISLLFPGLIKMTATVLEINLGRSFFLGLINILFVAVVDGLFVWLSQLIQQRVISGILVILAGLLTIVAVFFILLGLASLANLLGHLMGDVKNEFNANLRGGVLLFLAGLTPFIGWFAFTPLTLMLSLGAALQLLFRQKVKAIQSTPPL